MQNLVTITINMIGKNLIQTVNARELHKFLENKAKFADWIQERITQYEFTQHVDFVVIHQITKDDTAFGGNRKTIEYYLSLDMAKELSMVERNAKGKEARQYFIECERIAKQEASKPKTPLELAREQVALFERLEQIEIERDLAIATKAEIGSRREATAMNTVSQAVKKVNSLEIELDHSKQYATIKRMEMTYHGIKFDWRQLKSASNDLGIEPISVFDQNYGTVKSYHRDVWKEAYAVEVA